MAPTDIMALIKISIAIYCAWRILRALWDYAQP